MLFSSLQAQQHVVFATSDSGLIAADLYGAGERAVVLALNFRGDGQSRVPGQEEFLTAPLHLDVLAAVRHLKKKRCETCGRGAMKHGCGECLGCSGGG